jgi:hypothetical protein
MGRERRARHADGKDRARGETEAKATHHASSTS